MLQDKCVCFSSTDVQAVNNSHFGKPRKPVHLSNVHCTGSEEQILSCTHFEFTSLDDKKKALNESEVAGVICQPNSTPSDSGPTSGNNNNNNIPASPTISSTSGVETTEVHFDQLASLVMTNYLIAFALIVGLLVATFLAIV